MYIVQTEIILISFAQFSFGLTVVVLLVMSVKPSESCFTFIAISNTRLIDQDINWQGIQEFHWF